MTIITPTTLNPRPNVMPRGICQINRAPMIIQRIPIMPLILKAALIFEIMCPSF
jgi:hypothetical protein